MFRSIFLLAVGLVLLSPAATEAQDPVLGQEYGAGVHAYFSGDYVTAYQHLTAAIQGGSKDPRAYYFRGLASLNLGREPDAAIDFRKGAELESSDIHRFYNVGKALERVQGSARVELERYRVAARMAAYAAAERLRKERYEALRREESRVLRRQAESAPPDGEEIVPPEPRGGDEDDNIFLTPGERAVPKKPSKAAPDDKEDENPFATEPGKGDKKEGDKKEKEEKEKKPEAKKPDDKAKKPDEKKPDDKDPFAEPAPDEKKPNEKKPDEKKPDEKKPDDKDKEKKKEEAKPDPDDPFAE